MVTSMLFVVASSQAWPSIREHRRRACGLPVPDAPRWLAIWQKPALAGLMTCQGFVLLLAWTCATAYELQPDSTHPKEGLP